MKDRPSHQHFSAHWFACGEYFSLSALGLGRPSLTYSNSRGERGPKITGIIHRPAHHEITPTIVILFRALRWGLTLLQIWFVKAIRVRNFGSGGGGVLLYSSDVKESNSKLQSAFRKASDKSENRCTHSNLTPHCTISYTKVVQLKILGNHCKERNNGYDSMITRPYHKN